MNIMGAKLLASFLFFCLAVIFGWMPYFCFRRYSKQVASVRTSAGQRPIVLEYLHSLASGVLIGTCFLHLLPESLAAVAESLSLSDSAVMCPLAETINITNMSGHKTSGQADCQQPRKADHFPVAECLVALGFLFVYMIDSSIRSCTTSQRRQSYTDADTGNRGQSVGDRSPHPSRYSLAQEDADDNSSHQQLIRTDRPGKAHVAGQGKQFASARWLRSKLSSPADEPAKQNQADMVDEHRTFIAPDADSHSDLDGDHEQVEFNSWECESTRSTMSVEAHPLAAWRRAPGPESPTQLRSVTLVSALCIHGFFDGVMLGLQTSLPVVMSLMLALSVHKSFVSVGLATSLLTSQHGHVAARVTLCYIVAFASTAPLGVVVSAALLHTWLDTGDRGVVPGCLQAFAVGTFMYVSFTETAEGHQRRKLPVSLVNLLLVLTGFSLMSALRAVLGSV